MSQPPPYQPGQTLSYAQPQSGIDLHSVATRQRAVMLCILGYLACVLFQFALPPSLRWILGLAAIVVSVTGAVFVFMLAITLYNTGGGIVLGILTLIPVVGLIVLLIVNARATRLLREHGIRVGLLGADMSQVPSAGNVRVN